MPLPLAGLDVECADIDIGLGLILILQLTSRSPHYNKFGLVNSSAVQGPGTSDGESSEDDLLDELLMGLASGVPSLHEVRVGTAC